MKQERNAGVRLKRERGESMDSRRSGLSRQVQGNSFVAFPGRMEERPLDGGGDQAFGSLFMERQVMEDGSRSGVSDMGAASMMSDSPYMDREGYRDDAHVQSSSRNVVGASDAFLSGGSRGHAVYDHLSEERHFGAARQSLYGVGGSPSLERSSEHVGSSSSRSAACKRKSCGPVAPGNMSSRSGSPRRTGYRDGYIGRTGGSNGMGMRTSGVGGSSSSPEAVGSSSSPSDDIFLGRYGEVPPMAEDSVPRRMGFGDESSPDSAREGRYGKSVAGGSSGIPNSQRTRRSGGANGVVLNSSGSSPFPRTVRRAMPSHENLPRRTPVPDSSMADNGLGTSSSGSPFEQMLQRSEGPVLGGGRLRRSEGPVGGDRAMARYLENSTRGGGAGLESRLRSRVLSHHSDLMSQSLQAMSQTAPHPGGSSTPSPSRLPPHPPSLRGRLHGSSLQSLLPPPSSASGSAPSRLAPTPSSRMPPKPSSVDPLSFAPSTDSLPSPAALFRGSLMHGSSPAGLRDREFMSTASEGFLGTPLRGLQISAGDGGSQPRLGPEGLAEILLALERVERDEDLTYEQLLMLEATLLFGGMGLHDEHSDMRLDVDNMSYEELLALEERIGNVSTGLTSDAIEQKLKKTWYCSLDAVVARHSQECDIKCSICQEEYSEGDEVGMISCGHGYHWQCISQWLLQKNQCPICKAAAFS